MCTFMDLKGSCAVQTQKPTSTCRCPNQPSYQASLPPLPPLSEPLVGRVHPLALSVLRLNYDMPQQRQPQVLAEMESTLAAVMQHHNAQSNLSHADVGLFVAHAAHVQSVCEDVLVSSLQYQDHKAHKPTSCQANTSVSCRGAPQWGNPQVSKKLKRCPNQPSYQASLPPLPPLSEPLVGRVHPLALSVLRLNYDMPQQRQPQVLAEMESTLAAVMQHHNAQYYQDHKAHKPTSCQANTSVSCRGAPQWGNPQVSKKLKRGAVQCRHRNLHLHAGAPTNLLIKPLFHRYHLLASLWWDGFILWLCLC
ncbi:uncharacterized protein LOC114852340 isoform X20 [Betta splendens]|uniref:Uncharacterized protein LOC114852340 isoform X20 n=1 Tax=Betta splendens TaxID=158456 RepID=A0A9W2Y1H5_BETSP|nr:uncharacterized protein LOC114852340 isoform X20 [Betta splendens]